eukprot:scaffold1786_cov398-Prasinococcus_capsulatus_cf.AAC.11
MSWQAYIDSSLLGSGVVSEAVIAGQDGATWAKSPGLVITDDEVKAIVAGFKDPSSLYANGLRAGMIQALEVPHVASAAADRTAP